MWLALLSCLGPGCRDKTALILWCASLELLGCGDCNTGAEKITNTILGVPYYN